MKRKLFFLICFCLLQNIFSQKNEHEIHYSQEIFLTGKNNYKEIILDKEILTKAKNDVSDIRILDEHKNDVPYFLYNSVSYENVVDTFFESKYLGTFIEEEKNVGVFQYFDFAIIKQEKSDKEHRDVYTDVYGNQLHIETENSSFAETVEIFGSHDGINWNFITQSFLYDVNEYSQKIISFNQVEKYSFYRMKAKEKTLRPKSLTLVYTEVTENKKYFTKEFSPTFSIAEKDRNTIITIPKSEIRFLHIDSIQFETSGTFQRDVDAFYVSGEMYRFPFQEELLEKNYIEIDRTAYDADWIITIYNEDNKALEIKNITLTYHLQNLVFDSNAGTSFLLTYGDSTLVKPRYDIINFSEYILKEEIDLCALGSVTENLLAESKSFFGLPFEKLFMNVAIILAALILLVIIVAGLKKHGDS
jgi:hypothetical protein